MHELQILNSESRLDFILYKNSEFVNNFHRFYMYLFPTHIHTAVTIVWSICSHWNAFGQHFFFSTLKNTVYLDRCGNFIRNASQHTCALKLFITVTSLFSIHLKFQTFNIETVFHLIWFCGVIDTTKEKFFSVFSFK